MGITKNLELTIQAALEAGKKIMEIYNTDFKVEEKKDFSPLTEADQQANTIITTFLKPTNIPIISEETKQTDYQVRKNWNLCWIVDPVDGTKEFIKRNGEFTVNIALVKKGKPLLGVVYAPALQEIYFAEVENQKAYKTKLNTLETALEEIVNDASPLQPNSNVEQTVKVVGSRSHMNEATQNYIDTLIQQGKKVEVVAKGSSLKFCLVAEGKADVYPRFAPTMEWDTAAGQAICNAVGVLVSSEETKKPLLYNKENLLNPWFLVAVKNNG